MEAGLSESVVLVYLEIVRSPAQTKWQLVNRTGLNKSHVYRAFECLEGLKMIKKTSDGIIPLSLETLADDIYCRGKNLHRLAAKIRKLNPFLNAPTGTVSDFKILSTQSQILDAYMMMSQLGYDTNLDFGDLEGFVPVVGGMGPILEFRVNRFKLGSKNRAICTTFGPNTACVLRKKEMEKFKGNVQRMDLNFNGKWIIFSDNKDYVLYNDFSDLKAPSSVLVKSKVVADSQRMMFDKFYNNIEKF